MYADDTAILSETPEGLQATLDKLYEYCNKWGLKLNTTKTKVMVFRKRGRLRQHEQWSYNDESLEIVDNFNYLGTVFSNNGKFPSNQQMLVGNALKAMNCLLYNSKTFDFTAKCKCQLFDAFVSSILMYSCEVWGGCKFKEVERMHIRFCKRILNVKLSTSNAGIYGELVNMRLYFCLS